PGARRRSQRISPRPSSAIQKACASRPAIGARNSSSGRGAKHGCAAALEHASGTCKRFAVQATFLPGPLGSARRRLVDLSLSTAGALGAAMLLALAAAPVVGDEWLPERTLALAVVGAGFVVFFALRHLGGNGFGFANRVTLARGALTAFVL